MRTLSFIGSKLTLGPMLRDALVTHFAGVDLSTVPFVDAFFGSGAFTLAVHDLFGDLYLNDLEVFSYALAHALFTQPLDFSAARAADDDDGYVTRTYCVERGFFTPENGRIVDGFREWARAQPPGPARWSAIGCLLSALDARANTASVYGAFIKKALPKSLPPVDVRPLYVGHPGGRVTVTRGDAVAACLAAPPGAFLYLDPPYVKRSYAANYFVLNVVAVVEEEPEVTGVTGIPVAGYNRSAWNKADTSLAELQKILAGTRATRVAMSYSTDGLMSPAAITACFNASGWDVTCKTVQQRRFKSHDEGVRDTSTLKEIVFLGNKRVLTQAET
jgi:adenine-specific DNA-methyltransferase